jgi:tRNA(Ser,Leu) C12 N-acetylase TAN1
MASWNVLITAYENREKDLLAELEGLGEFERTGFRNTLVGSVQSVEQFLEELKKRHCPSLSRVAPIASWFKSEVAEVEERLKEAVLPFVEKIAEGESFCVRVERRGMKGLVQTKQLEIELGSYISAQLEEKYGRKPKVNLTDPDKLIRIETLGNNFGLGLVSKKMRESYPFVK